jgi:hypothetical protein
MPGREWGDESDRGDRPRGAGAGVTVVAGLGLLFLLLSVAGFGWYWVAARRAAVQAERDLAMMEADAARAEAEVARIRAEAPAGRRRPPAPPGAHEPAGPAATDAGPWHDAAAGAVRVGDGQFQVKSAGYVEDGRGTRLAVHVEFTNASADRPARVQGDGADRSYLDQQTDGKNTAPRPGVTTFPGVSLRSGAGVAFRPLLRTVREPTADTAGEVRVPPRGTAAVSYSFEPPPKDAKELYLELPAADFGQPAAAVRFRVPASMVKRDGR